MDTSDHHSEYLTRAVEALTAEGRERVDELLEQLAVAGAAREWVVRFATARRAEADDGIAAVPKGAEPAAMLGEEEIDVLVASFTTIRDSEPLDDVADWANAVLALLHDARA